MILNSPTISGSLTVTGNIIASGSITLSGSVASASYADTASFVALAQSASNAVSAATASFANAFTVASTLTAQTLVVQTITSSVDFVTGSTRFGSIAANTHLFTGSVSISGSSTFALNVNSGSLFVSSSGFVGMNTTQSFNSTLTVAPLKTPGVAFQVIADSDGRGTSLYTSDYVSSISGSTLRMGFVTGSKNTNASIQAYIAGENTYGSLLLNSGGGNVGIGTATPSYTLDVSGTGRFTSTLLTGGDITVSKSGDSGINLNSTTTNGVAVTRYQTTAAGNLWGTGINITAGDSRWEVYNFTLGSSPFRISNAGAATFSGTITSQVNGSTFGSAALSGRAITLQASSGDGAILFKNLSGGDGTLSITGTSTTMNYYFSTYSVGGAFVINNNGNCAVAGALSKGSGTFRIDHPLESKKDTHQLVHSFVEGPRADLIYRGTTTLVNGTATINIDTSAGMTEGTFIALNRETQFFITNQSGWNNIKGSLQGNILTIEAEDTNSTDTIAWMVVGERQDKHIKDTDWTDENGKPILEPLKSTE